MPLGQRQPIGLVLDPLADDVQLPLERGGAGAGVRGGRRVCRRLTGDRRRVGVRAGRGGSDEDLLEDFKLKTPNWLSWYRQDDRYSREELSGDIEKLRSQLAKMTSSEV